MSINVTVTGNPVKIHRGKMVTRSDLSQDADKRRKIRLQQVRQQSKDLAAAVRNNSKKAKSKQNNEYEKQNQAKLREWQNKKLLQLTCPCDEPIKDIHVTHSDAMIVESEEQEQLHRQKIVNDARAVQRGKIAQEIAQIEKNQTNLKKAIPRQTKQITREVENARAAMIANQMKQSPKKKKVTKKSFKVIENVAPTVPDSNDIEVVDETEEINTEMRSPPRQVQLPSANLKSPTKNLSVSKTSFKENHQLITADKSVESNVFTCTDNIVEEREERVYRSPKKRYRQEDVSSVSINSVDIPPDTRISDRIKSRYLISSSSYMSVIPEGSSSSNTPEENKENEEIHHMLRPNFSTTTQHCVSILPTSQNVQVCPVCEQNTNPFKKNCAVVETCTNTEGQTQLICVPPPDGCPKRKSNLSHTCQVFEIPSKPAVSIARDTYAPQYTQKDNATNPNHGQYRKVRSIDCNKRFSHQYVTDTSHVQRIQKEDLVYDEHSKCEAGPSNRCHGEFSRHADERAKTAEIRGKKALEKNMVHKDYEELMRKLPILQKKGRIAKLNAAKDKHHMSEERKKQHEQQRQQEMEHAFERLATAKITIPPVKRNKSPKSPKSQSPRTRSRSPTHKTTQPLKSNAKTSEIFSAQTCGTEDLLGLLEKLKTQKEELMKECKDLPQDSNFYTLIEDLDFVARKKASTKSKKIQTNGDAPISRKVSDAKSEKSHKRVLILQNTSTQTSPKVCQAPSSTSTDTCPPTTESPIKSVKSPHTHCKHSKIVCDGKEGDKLCEILIKIHDSSSTADNSKHKAPEIVLRPVNRIEDSLNLETGKSGKSTRKKSPDGSEKGISPKRSRSESPKKTPRKNLNTNVHKTKAKTKALHSTPASPPKQKLNRSKQDNWKHYLKTSSVQGQDDFTSCTSYYSPPDYNMQAKKDKSNQSEPNKVINQNLLQHICKLLELSKDKLETATANVSSISEIQTPASSILSTNANRPRKPNINENNDSTNIEKLSTILEYFNLTPGDFRNFVHFQSTSSTGSRNCSESCSGRTSPNSTTGYQGNRLINSSQESHSRGITRQNEKIADQFSQWAELCQARINNLTQMINKVRLEKQDILVNTKDQTSSIVSETDKKQSPVQGRNNITDNSNPLEKTNNATVYLNLPPRSNSSSPHSPSLEQAKLNKQLLDVVDSSHLQPETIPSRNTEDLQKLLDLPKTHPDLDQDMVERYLKLIDVELKAQRTKSPEKKQPTCETMSFTPLLDIPKLPKFQPQPSTSTAGTPMSKSKKPPVAQNALRFNEIFHELSVIPEAETSRLSKSPQKKSTRSPTKSMTSPVETQTLKTTVKQKTKIVTELSSDSVTTDKSNESVESMLKNIGLDWAINTLKKMNAVNNNSSSSSSSLDIDHKKFNYLLNKNVSTSTEKSCSTPIDDNLSRLQRTSTPVQNTNSSKSQRSQKLINSEESEISPVYGTTREKKALSPVSFGPVSFTTMPIISIHDQSDS